jgi:bacterioferritin
LARDFARHATCEHEHADKIAERIARCGGRPDFEAARRPYALGADYAAGTTLEGLLREDLAAERVIIQSHRDIALFLGEADRASRSLMEEVLATEEEHAHELLGLLAWLGDGAE